MHNEAIRWRSVPDTMKYNSKGQKKKFVHTKGNSKEVTCLLFAFLLSIPLVSLYIGYSISTYFAPTRNIISDMRVVVDSSKLNYSQYRTHNISIGFVGGIGNQMFQYAALYGLGKANGLKPVVPEKNDLWRVFPGLKAEISKESNIGKHWPKFREFKSNAFDTTAFSLNFQKDIQLAGYFQSWRYFDHVRADVKKQLTFHSEIQYKVDMFFKISLSNLSKPIPSGQLPNYVGVHVRRGDYIDKHSRNQGYRAAEAAYFEKAMNFISERLENVVFVVTSDDMDWSRRHLSSSDKMILFSHFDHPAIDLCLLSKCNHTIMSVGTFGWWGAWLAGGETIYYKDFVKPGSEIEYEFKRSDYFLPHWIPL